MSVNVFRTKCLCGYEDSISSLTDKKISCSAECPTKACIIVQVYSTTTKTVETTTVKPVVNNIHIDQLSTLETIDFITSGKDVSDCLNNCSHRGLCVLDVGNNKYACNCTSGYYGENCQLSVNPCYSYPCLNNATCSYDPVNNTYECKCSGFYSGTNCESKITMCNNITCSGHGSCVNQPNSTLGYSCQCYYFYSGSDCQVEDRSKKLVTAAVSTSVVISIFMIMATCGLVICLDLFKLSLFYSKQLPRSDYRVKKLPKSEYFQ